MVRRKQKRIKTRDVYFLFGSGHPKDGRVVRSNGFIHFDLVKIEEEEYALCFNFDGKEIRLTGSGCRGWFEGWRAELLFSGFAPVLVLQLAHSDGTRAVWYLGSDGSRLAGHIDELDHGTRQLVRNAAARLLRPLTRSLLEDAQPLLSPIEQDFLYLAQEIKLEIFASVKDLLLPAPETQTVSGSIGYLPIAAREGCQVVLPCKYLNATLQHKFQDTLLETLQAGHHTFRIASPFDGDALEAQGSLCFDDFHFAYRFIDESRDVVFYLIVGYEVSQAYCLYFPVADLLICLPQEIQLSQLIAKHLAIWLPQHFIHFTSEYISYLQGPCCGITSLLRAPPWTHIGHQLWNELTGIDNILKKTNLVGSVEWVVPDGERAVEFYGPIDKLFPQLRGRVLRGLRNATDAIQYVYSNKRLAVRITQSFVSADLRSRVLNHAASSVSTSRDLMRLKHGAKKPIILLGLRVENRTLVNLSSFFHFCIERILMAFPESRFIIDGHNVASARGSKYRSHGECIDEARIVERTEQDIFENLKGHFGDDVVTNSVGLTIAEALQLANQSDFFISPWGAGLAKYRWVCNKPGFIITSKWNLTRRADLGIYDRPDMLEEPSPTYWIDEALVTDQPEAPRIVSAGDHPQWSNFSVHEERTIESILEALRQTVEL